MTNLSPEKGYISKRLFATITAYLDQHKIMTDIIKIRRLPGYNVHINGELVNKRRLLTRNAAKRIIWKKFIQVLEKGITK